MQIVHFPFVFHLFKVVFNLLRSNMGSKLGIFIFTLQIGSLNFVQTWAAFGVFIIFTSHQSWAAFGVFIILSNSISLSSNRCFYNFIKFYLAQAIPPAPQCTLHLPPPSLLRTPAPDTSQHLFYICFNNKYHINVVFPTTSPGLNQCLRTACPGLNHGAIFLSISKTPSAIMVP